MNRPPPLPSPFLQSPLKEGSYRITEGWIYSAEETAAHGFVDHHAIDFAAPVGTPVYAAADGLAYAAYRFRYVFFDKERTRIRTYQGKTVACSLGNHVVIVHALPHGEDFSLSTIYGHLSQVAPTIPMLPSTHVVDGPDVRWKPIQESANDPTLAVPVKQGDLIGYVGISGMEWGVEGSPILPYDPSAYWDEPHTHFELQLRDSKGERRGSIDPFGLYAPSAAYESLTAKGQGLWL